LVPHPPAQSGSISLPNSSLAPPEDLPYYISGAMKQQQP
jgi:hypothetical protein